MCFPYRPDADAAELLNRQPSPSDQTRRQLSIDSLESSEFPSAPIPHPVVSGISYNPTNLDTLISPLPSAMDVSSPLPVSIKLPIVPMVHSSSMKLDLNAKNRTILVTDDAPTILKVVTKLLVNNGYMVETANNGSQVRTSNNSPHIFSFTCCECHYLH